MKKKEMLSAQATKMEFINSIHNWLMRTLRERGNEQYCDCFKVEGGSIMCNLPSNFFDRYDIPAGTRIEMKFIAKKG